MNSVSRVKTKDRTLVDPIRQSPVDVYQARFRRRAAVALVIAAAAAVLAWYWLA